MDEWIENAACARAADPDLFFAGENEILSRLPRKAIFAANNFCAECPVRAECSEVADRDELIGLWGGVWRTFTRRYQIVGGARG